MTDAVLHPTAGFPAMAATRDRVEPAPRRVRGVLNGAVVFDTRRALYVWEVPYYPQYYIPLDDVTRDLLVDEGREMSLRLGPARRHGLRVADQTRDAAARVYGAGSALGLDGFVRFEWEALDAWFEEDEQIFVHPRNPYAVQRARGLVDLGLTELDLDADPVAVSVLQDVVDLETAVGFAVVEARGAGCLGVDPQVVGTRLSKRNPVVSRSASIRSGDIWSRAAASEGSPRCRLVVVIRRLEERTDGSQAGTLRFPQNRGGIDYKE